MSKMPSFGRRLPPLVVATVRVAHRRIEELLEIDIVETGDFDGHIVTSYLFDVTAFECAHAAIFTKQVRALPGPEAVVTHRLFARDEPEGVRLDDDVPVARLRADGAVAL